MSAAVMQVVVLDEGDGRSAGEARLWPLTDLRAAFDVRTGAFTALERLERVLAGSGFGVAGVIVPARLAGVTGERHGLPVNDGVRSAVAGAGSVIVVNGRAPTVGLEVLERLRADGECVVDQSSGSVIAARMRGDAIVGDLQRGRVVHEVPAVLGPTVLSRAWHVRSVRDRCLGVDLGLLARELPIPGPMSGVAVAGGHPVYLHASAAVMPGVVFDVTQGPVAVLEGATVRPGAIVCGPAVIGAHATVIDRAVIRGGTVLGPRCKERGEVGGTIFQAYSNKGHDGYLGDSYVGEWVNLGAMTTNSNLLNTYGEVTAKAGPGGSSERTGEQFLGCVLGDHVKTAIATRIMTGAVVGTGTMWAATAPVIGTVGSARWVTDAGERPYRFEKLEEVARAMMGRRKITPSDAYVSLLKHATEASAGAAAWRA